MTKKRALAKSITYRISAIIITFIVLYVGLSEVALSAILTAVTHILKTILFYAHERIWSYFSWGRKDGK